MIHHSAPSQPHLTGRGIPRIRRNRATGIAAAALALTACGIAVGSPGGTPAGHSRASRPVPGRQEHRS
jgi:hypothetical protein